MSVTVQERDIIEKAALQLSKLSHAELACAFATTLQGLVKSGAMTQENMDFYIMSSVTMWGESDDETE